MELEQGVTVAGFRIEAPIGRGPTGSVYLAHDVALDRLVALKVLDPEAASDAGLRERVLGGARRAAALEHPHVLEVHAAGESDGRAFVAMRHVAGGDLAGVLARDGPLAGERVLRIGAQAAAAVDAAHASGLLHGDLKPSNLLVDAEDQVYVADFGAGPGGTGAYRAPEQLEGGRTDARADVYALACVLFECLPERRALDAVFARALAREPERRPATCAELIADLGAALAGGPAPHTFVFADIRGYTAYTREHGDEVSADMLRRFAGIVEPLAPAHGGIVTQYRGDEALVVFESPRAALGFALDLQRRVAEDALPCGVGVGLDAGEAVPVAGSFHGTALNRAARLCAIARAGEVLATDGVLHLAGQFDGVHYGLRRLERLKGFAQPVGVNEIHRPDSAPSRQLRRRLARRLRGTRPRRRLAAAAVLAAATAVALLALGSSGGGGSASAAFRPNSIALLDPRTGAGEGTAAPGLQICVFAAAGRDLWACDADQSILVRIDPRTRRVVDQLPLPVYHGSFAIGFGSAWVGDVASPSVRRVSIRYRTSSPPIRLPGVPGRSPTGEPENVGSMVTAKGSVWAAYGFPKRIARIDPATSRVTFSRPLPQSCPCNAWLAADGGRLWAVGGDGVHVYRLDPRTGRTLATGRLHQGEVSGVAAVGGYLWVAVQQDDAVWKLDGTGSVVDKVPTGRTPSALAGGGGYLWVANADDGTVTRIDPATNARRTFRVGHRPLAVAELDGRLAVGLGQSAAEAAAGLRGPGVVRVRSGDAAGSIDPVDFAGPPDLELGLAAGSGLTAARTDAAGDTTIEPELAARPPTVSRGGRTYTFTLRPGLRFSSGAPVTAAAVRYSIERVLSPALLNHYCRDQVLHDIAGERAFEAGRAQHIAGLRASAGRVSITLARPSPTLPARLANPCLSVVPPGTPSIPVGLEHPIPSAGPYAVASFVPGEQVVLRRNRFYRGPRPRPLDALIVQSSGSAAAAMTAVQRGSADVAVDSGAPVPAFQAGGPLARRYGRPGGRLRYLQPPSSFTLMLALNTLRGPLRSARLRRAVNLALDRRALMGFGAGQPRSLLIPPGVPGYSPGQAYPVRGDLPRARALAAGRHATLVIAVAAGDAGGNDPMLAAGRRDLERIGLRVRLRLLADPVAAAADPRRHIDAVAVGWGPDYPDPFDVVNVVLDPAARATGLPPFFDDARWLARMRRAATAPQARRAAVYARLDRALVLGPAPVAVVGSPPGVPLLASSRLGCLDFVFGRIDLSSLCVRQRDGR